MRPIMLIGLVAVLLVPAGAQSRHGAGRNRDDFRAAQRDFSDDYRDEERWGRNDWRDWRRSHRGLYSRGRWRAPFAYRAFRPGLRIDEYLYGPRYQVVDPWRYRLPAARRGLRWIRHYDDVLLVDVHRGIVVDVIRNFFW